jgi:hypothetical protein
MIVSSPKSTASQCRGGLDLPVSKLLEQYLAVKLSRSTSLVCSDASQDLRTGTWDSLDSAIEQHELLLARL